MAMGWERFGAGGSSNGAVLATTEGAGLGRRLPGPSPALTTNYTNSTAAAPTAEAKGPGGRGAREEPRGAWRRSLERQGKGAKRGSRICKCTSSQDLALTHVSKLLVPNGRGFYRNRKRAKNGYEYGDNQWGG